MRYGHCDDAAREYVIVRPDTPLATSSCSVSRRSSCSGVTRSSELREPPHRCLDRCRQSDRLVRGGAVGRRALPRDVERYGRDAVGAGARLRARRGGGTPSRASSRPRAIRLSLRVPRGRWSIPAMPATTSSSSSARSRTEPNTPAARRSLARRRRAPGRARPHHATRCVAG